MNSKKIVITGGPGTGKTSLINELKRRGYTCLEEISRQITLEARKEGVEQLFLTKPLLFSERLLEGRIKQYEEAKNMVSNVVFIDRGVPDVLAYMDYANETYPNKFVAACNTYKYHQVFVLAPWQEIFISDGERYENFEQAAIIHEQLLNTYKKYNYNLINIPFDTIENRVDYLLDTLKKL
ncbi:ATP-binding protein [Xanthomarina sp. F2636L]|uniref:ATP-binding protein n=1 Tax=Xanthomarina sp. F2636L TaxID=2996018 RepID=UPI00225DDAC2|nr:ATP-binding protein [Xanthomarina sp. F2636L]MCX7550309.1 ATP-binding protein [Xanthomarina sp. F2636L]